MNSIPTEKQITEYQQKINENSTINIFPHGKIVELVKKESNFIQNLPIKEHIKVTKEITNQIRNQGGPLNSKEHYLRNSIDIAPNTLEEMLSKNGSDKIKWKILSPLMTAYHMFGENGQFNLKFVSDDGFYEAVYDYSGNLITDKKDAVNMATYNYADAITEPKKHLEYDVIPYWIWGNTGTDRKFEIRELVVNVSKFYSNKEVMIRYDKIAKKTFELYGVK
jgi:hypothetical protein